MNSAGTNLLQGIRTIVREERVAADLPCKGFSDVGSAEAEQLLVSLDLLEVNGNLVDPIEVPGDTATCSEFDYTPYPDEKAGNADALKHHQVTFPWVHPHINTHHKPQSLLCHSHAPDQSILLWISVFRHSL